MGAISCKMIAEELHVEDGDLDVVHSEEEEAQYIEQECDIIDNDDHDKDP